VVGHLGRLGYASVYNRWAAGKEGLGVFFGGARRHAVWLPLRPHGGLPRAAPARSPSPRNPPPAPPRCSNEDFYAVKGAGRCPEFDVLLTNPPFSGDHLERIFRFAVKSNKCTVKRAGGRGQTTL
jgi:hypothetical protein